MKAHHMFAATLALAAGLGGVAASAEETITLQFGTAAQPAWSLGKVIEEVLIPKLAEYSDGRIAVELHSGGSLCSEHACVEQLGLGQIDMATVSSGNVGAFGTTFDIINLPFLFVNQDKASAILNDWLTDELEARVEVTTPGCTLSKQGVAQTLADKVEEIFLFSLTLLTLVAFGRRPQR